MQAYNRIEDNRYVKVMRMDVKHVINICKRAYGFTKETNTEHKTRYGWTNPRVSFRFNLNHLFFTYDEIAEGLRKDRLLVIEDTYYITIANYRDKTCLFLTGGYDEFADVVAKNLWSFKNLATWLAQERDYNKAIDKLLDKGFPAGLFICEIVD